MWASHTIRKCGSATEKYEEGKEGKMGTLGFLLPQHFPSIHVQHTTPTTTTTTLPSPPSRHHPPATTLPPPPPTSHHHPPTVPIIGTSSWWCWRRFGGQRVGCAIGGVATLLSGCCSPGQPPLPPSRPSIGLMGNVTSADIVMGGLGLPHLLHTQGGR
jgi:hypothetical protein